MNDPSVRVTTPGVPDFGATWNINMTLSDRWGDLIYDHFPKDESAAASKREALAVLEADPALLERLRTQMWDELTFISRKDGEFGILFEVEYESIESDGEAGPDAGTPRESLHPYADVVKQLVAQAAVLQAQFPQVEFCVPEAAMVYFDRPAIWGFAKDGALDAGQRESLGHQLLDFAYPRKSAESTNDQPEPEEELESPRP